MPPLKGLGFLLDAYPGLLTWATFLCRLVAPSAVPGGLGSTNYDVPALTCWATVVPPSGLSSIANHRQLTTDHYQLATDN